MEYTAKALFADWYNNGIKKEATNEELQNRRAIIDSYIKSDDIGFWTGVLKIYLGINKEDNADYSNFVEKFRSNDDYFLVRNNNLIRLLAGCSIAEKIDLNNSYVSDFLALGIITHSLNKIDVLSELFPRAEKFWITECEKGRDISFNETPEKLKQFFPKVAMTAGSEGPAATTVADEVIKNLGLVFKDTNALLVFANKIIELTNQLKNNQSHLAEEMNVLWWLFGEYSDIVGRKFSEIEAQALSVIVPIELSGLTINLPGIGKLDSIISKALNTTDEIAYSLEEVVSSVIADTDKLKSKISQPDNSLIELTPFLTALQCFIEFAGSEWKAIYVKRTKIDLSSKVKLSVFANQLYKEIMLSRVFLECNN